ncbi:MULTISPECIES: site-specific tyrosine recombinase/integron integrase [Bacillus]|uniref:site-specific tyrosine recombinase/integron integrase n=1 Tax=Bacillus TaxID=1386 RepID=UPI0011DE37AE|nr:MULTISPECIES: site-specific tyrosine recombinase/integron integrase [Bacillus]
MTVINCSGGKRKMINYCELRILLPNSENQKVIHEFLLKKKDENRSKKTIRNYRVILQHFFKEREEPFSSLTSEDIQEWITQHQKFWKEDSMCHRIRILHVFYNFCVEGGYMDTSPVKSRKGVITELKGILPNAENQKVINEFLFSLKKGNRRKSTIVNNRKVLQHFFKERKESYSSLTSEDIQEWISKQEEVWEKGTIRTRLCSLRSFLKYCVEAGYMEKQPITTKRRKNKGKYWNVELPLPNSENLKVINEFLLSMKVSNYSERTIITYQEALQRFFRERKAPFSQLTYDDVREWLNQYQKVWKESTLYSNLSILSSFFNFCVEEGYLEKSVIKKRWYPRLPQPIPKYLDKEEIAKIRQQCEKEPLRNRAILEFLLTTGCRLGEVQRLNRDDVDLENRTARVVGKGKKIRLVHFSEKCALLLERYLEHRKDDNPAFFITKWGTRTEGRNIQNFLREIGKAARLSTSLHPHRLRHTFATELLAKGADLVFIGDEMGHVNLQTTQIYARLPKQDIVGMYRKYMG